MKKYIGIAALVVASVLITSAAIMKVTDKPQKKDSIWVSTTNMMVMGKSKEATLVHIEGKVIRDFVIGQPPAGWKTNAEIQTSAAVMATKMTDTYRQYMVKVITSTDGTNWYPVSFGDQYPETKEPRYFALWTQIDSSALTFEEYKKHYGL